MQVQLSPQRSSQSHSHQHRQQFNPPLSPMDAHPTSAAAAGLRRYTAPSSPTSPASPSSRQSTAAAPAHSGNNAQHDSANPETLSNATSSTAAAAQARSAANKDKEASSYPEYMPNPMFASFTKSRNWAQKLVDEVADLICVLTPQGNIVFASSSSRSLVGFGSDEMVHRHISEFIHPDDARHMALAVSTAARTGQPYHLIHRYRRKNADYVILEIHGRTMPPLSTYRTSLGMPAAAAAAPAGHVRDPTLIVSVGREYPGKLSPFLDSVLDLKIEHERLEVRRGEVEASVARNAALKRKQLLQLHTHPLPVQGAGGSEAGSGYGSGSLATMSQSPIMSPSSTGGASDDAGRERSGSLSIDDSTSSSGGGGGGGGGSSMPPRPMPSIPDMPVGQTPSTVGIFGPSGASAGATPGGASSSNAGGGGGGNLGWYDTSPGAAEIMRNVPQATNAAMAMPVAVPSSSHAEASASAAAAADAAGGGASEAGGDAAGEARRKRKKRVVSEIMDRVCISCGSTSSPEWRKGPTGAKTLCNACGLRYAKKVKTEQQALAQQQGGNGAAGDAAAQE